MKNLEQEYTLNTTIKGHVRIWEYSPERGYGKLLVDKPNLITKSGASVAARALAGQASAGITHMYVGYDTGSTHTAVSPAVTDTIAQFTNPLIVPLAYAPSFSNTDSTYLTNVVYFTIYLTGFDSTRQTSLVNGDSINSLGLVNRTYLVNGGGYQDYLFSRIAISPYVTYNHSLAITWGITFTAA